MLLIILKTLYCTHALQSQKVALAVIIVVEPPPEWLVDGLIYDENCPKLVYNENDLMCKYGHTIHMYEHKYHNFFFFGNAMFVTISNEHFCIQISYCLWNGTEQIIRRHKTSAFTLLHTSQYNKSIEIIVGFRY